MLSGVLKCRFEDKDGKTAIKGVGAGASEASMDAALVKRTSN